MFGFKKLLYVIQLRSFNPLHRFIYALTGAVMVASLCLLAAWLISEKQERDRLNAIITERNKAKMCLVGGEEAAAVKFANLYNEANKLFTSIRFAKAISEFVGRDLRPKSDILKEVCKNEIKVKEARICVNEGSQNNKIRIAFELAGCGVFPMGPIYCFDRSNPRCAEQSCIFSQSGEILKLFVSLVSKKRFGKSI